MKREFLKIILFIWLAASLYFLYEMWIDVGWMADAMHAYMKFVMEHIGH